MGYVFCSDTSDTDTQRHGVTWGMFFVLTHQTLTLNVHGVTWGMFLVLTHQTMTLNIW